MRDGFVLRHVDAPGLDDFVKVYNSAIGVSRFFILVSPGHTTTHFSVHCRVVLRIDRISCLASFCIYALSKIYSR